MKRQNVIRRWKESRPGGLVITYEGSYSEIPKEGLLH